MGERVHQAEDSGEGQARRGGNFHAHQLGADLLRHRCGRDEGHGAVGEQGRVAEQGAEIAQPAEGLARRCAEPPGGGRSVEAGYPEGPRANAATAPVALPRGGHSHARGLPAVALRQAGRCRQQQGFLRPRSGGGRERAARIGAGSGTRLPRECRRRPHAGQRGAGDARDAAARALGRVRRGLGGNEAEAGVGRGARVEGEPPEGLRGQPHRRGQGGERRTFGVHSRRLGQVSAAELGAGRGDEGGCVE
mmetsp:Transcript_81127/g.262829  ORF Transcript_81127/g.262829 Transcript_81127/m.262829 type:complete len:249 (+) Transcript_81127:2815-3561(+)